MQHARFAANPCPIARGLDRVGEWWNILILRDAFQGATRFDQFQKNLGIAPNILSRRLRGLVAAGLLEKVRYNDHPPRDEYLLTPIGRAFRPVLRAMLAWGNTHFMPDGQQVVVRDSATATEIRSQS
jgi:DNA-binding HxlR family transcriptional regulator